MCLNPITIPNQSKYISTKHKDMFLMQVPCGHCAECQQTISNQWYYRAWYEWNEVQASGGYVLFDTLTYAPKYLPHLSDFWSLLDKKEDYSCFNPAHIRNFLQTLRLRLIRAGYRKESFRYFLSTEYGLHCTNRPHIHILLYVYDNRIDPIWLSQTISDVWYYGRTDGIPYKSRAYVLGKNVVKATCDEATKLRTCRYVTKYVQKCCVFDKELNKRVAKVMSRLAVVADPVSPEVWLESELARRERLKLLRYVNQFHRQSQHFGESALADIDLNQLFRDGCLYMPDNKRLMIPVPLPMYYKRKMFYDLIEFNGSRYWVKNELGKEYTKVRFADIRQRLIDRYQCICLDNNLAFDSKLLADYVLTQRGRIKGFLPESTLVDRLNDIDYINYSTCSDKLNFGCRGLSTEWLGDSQQGYLTSHLSGRITFSQFVSKYVFFDPVLEKQLDVLFQKMISKNEKKQRLFELQQRLRDLYKSYFPTKFSLIRYV